MLIDANSHPENNIFCTGAYLLKLMQSLNQQSYDMNELLGVSFKVCK